MAGSRELHLQAHKNGYLCADATELGASGKLIEWERTADLAKIDTPTLDIGAQYDTMDPEHMEWMPGQMLNGRYLLCPNVSHMALNDDRQHYFQRLSQFVKDVDTGHF